MDPILEQFLTEARDNLEYLDKHLEELQDGDDETINALFRAAHTLKGGAGLVGLTQVKEITHAAEDLLDAYRNKKIEYSDEMVDILYDAFDEVVELIDAVEELGSPDIDADIENVERLKNSIRGFLAGKKSTENASDSSSEVELTSEVLEINEEIDATLFTPLQIKRLAPQIPLHKEKYTEDFVTDNHWYLVDVDLDVETLKLGHDPIYLFYLLNCDDMEVAVETNCEFLKEDNLNWVSRIVAAIYTSEEQIVDSFFNIIEEVFFRYLSIEVLFDSHYDSIENEMYDEFKEEFLDIIRNEKYEVLDEKLSAINQVLNIETKEGYILHRLQIILTEFEVGSDEYKEIIKIALDKLELDLDSQPTQSQETTSTQDSQESTDEPQTIDAEIEESSTSDSSIDIDNEEKEMLDELLEAQLKILQLATDEVVVDRTKLIIEKVVSVLGKDISVPDTKDGLVSLINQLLGKQATPTDSQPEQQAQPESSQPEPSQPEQSDSSEPESSDSSEPSQPQAQPQHTSSQSSTNKPKLQVPQKQTSHKSATPKTVKIEQNQIDELMDIVGELLVVKNAFPYISEILSVDNIEESKRELNTKYEEISRIIEQLQDRVMQMRLLPLEYIFGRYPKLVRDISKKLNKKIKYIESGGDTKLDKTVIEKLADPLVHIIRNSLDHGIETPEERIKAGKNPEGTLEIKASSQGDKVFIIIKDDGRGIDVDKVVNKALEKKLISPEALDNMTKEDKLKLIFLPGLSTKDEITDLSGRGVGTDAVKKIIEELGGKIYVKSEVGYGTEIKLELPLSVALTNVFHIMMNNVNYAIPMDYIVETVKIEKQDIQIANHNPFIKIRGELIPLLLEKELLGYSDVKDINAIVIIKLNDKKVGFVVDEFVGQLDVVQKPLTGVISTHPFMSGVSLLGNGDILFILDVSKVLKDVNE